MAHQTTAKYLSAYFTTDATYLDWRVPITAGDLRDTRKFTEAQAKEFLRHYEVIKHQSNTINGFSATLFLGTKGTANPADDTKILAI